MKGEIAIKVYYEDTDALGTVYYANYLRYYERGRTELFADHGHAVEDLNARGVNILVYHFEATFRRAGRLGDRLRVITEMQDSDSPYRIRLGQSIHRGDELINQAGVQLVCVDASGTLREFPDELRRLG